MFSCCRANPKNSKKSKKINEDNAKEQQETSQQNDALSKNGNKKLIIPTITIENGKTTTDNISNDELNENKVVIECDNNEKDELKNEYENVETTAATKVIEESLAKTESVTVQPTEIEVEATSTDSPRIVETNVGNITQTNDAEIICSETLQETNIFNEVDIKTNATDIVSSAENARQDVNNCSQTNDIAAESPSTTQSSRCDTNIINNGKPRSCLSRHNSTHTSIKKRVNINIHTEIIEPDPLLPIIPITSSIGDEEDDVFSDSLPPPKRESMCAPYLERDIGNDDLFSETAYSHGLPEWFNDERINDV